MAAAGRAEGAAWSGRRAGGATPCAAPAQSSIHAHAGLQFLGSPAAVHTTSPRTSGR